MMDEFDKRLYSALGADITIPSKLEKVIKESLTDNNLDKKSGFGTAQRSLALLYRKNRRFFLYNKKVKHHSIQKIGIAACTTIIATAGIVYAGTAISNYIWKQPEKTTGFYSNNTQNITNEERASAMSRPEAIEKTNELLRKFGYENKKIISMELNNNPHNYELTWHVTLDNGTSNDDIIEFDARGGDSFNVLFQNVLKENNYRITKDEAEKTARELCKKYGYDTQKYNKVKIKPNLEKSEDSYMWYADFYMDYEGIINPYESLKIAFTPKTNDIYYFYVSNFEFENNPVEVSKEKAKEIVLISEQKMSTNYKIKNVVINLSIDKMNGDAFKRLTDYEQYYKEGHDKNFSTAEVVSYRTQSLVRKVWKVTLEYDIPQFTVNFKSETNPFDRYYTYYVDATTGEIIGGVPYKAVYLY